MTQTDQSSHHKFFVLDLVFTIIYRLPDAFLPVIKKKKILLIVYVRLFIGSISDIEHLQRKQYKLY